MLTFTSIRSSISSLARPVQSIYKETTVAPVSSSVAPVQNAVTLGGQAEHASLPSLAAPSKDSGYLGTLPRPTKQSLGGALGFTGLSTKWLVIIGVGLVALWFLAYRK